MDLFWLMVLCILFFFLFSVCGWCCKRKREGTVYGFGPNLSVWTQRAPAASPVVAPPYPVDSSRVVPGAAPLGFDQLNMPGASPYPPPAAPYYYPPPMGNSPIVQPPYPPPNTGYGQPPPYHVAVSQPPPQPQPSHEAYSKQSPYNPNYPQP